MYCSKAFIVSGAGGFLSQRGQLTCSYGPIAVTANTRRIVRAFLVLTGAILWQNAMAVAEESRG